MKMIFISPRMNCAEKPGMMTRISDNIHFGKSPDPKSKETLIKSVFP